MGVAEAWVIFRIKHHDIGEAFPESCGLNTGRTLTSGQLWGNTSAWVLTLEALIQLFWGETGASGMLTSFPGDPNVEPGLGTSAL